MRKNEKGFSLVEVILIILVIGLAGYIVWSITINKNTPTTVITVPTATTIPTPEAKDETAGWYEHQPKTKEYTIKLPDGWSLLGNEESPSLYGFTPNDIAYIPGTKATVATVGGRDWNTISFLLAYHSTSDGTFGVTGSKQPTFKTTAGLAVDKYYNVVATDPEVMGPPKGTRQYFYVIKKGANTIVVQHDIAAGEADQTSIIEKSIKTLVF